MGHLNRVLAGSALCLCAVLVLGACSSGGASSGQGSDASSGQLLIATTVSPITSIAAAIAGDKAQVEGIVPEGTNSHTYEPAPQVAELLSKANIIFVNGLKLEDPTVELAKANKQQTAEIVEIGTTVLPESDYIYDFSFPKSEGKPNPHLWTDPLYAIKYAAVIRDSLSKADPANAATYAANYETFAAQATALADALRKDQATIPAGNKKLLTYTTPTPTSRRTSAGTSSARSSPRTSPTPPRPRSPRLSIR